MNADPILILLVCALLLVVAIWAAVRDESQRGKGEDPPTLDTRGPD